MFRAQARWHVNGVEHLGPVDPAHEAKVGDQLDIWVDGNGNLVAAPTPI
jgi:hypothetical protein